MAESESRKYLVKKLNTDDRRQSCTQSISYSAWDCIYKACACMQLGWGSKAWCERLKTVHCKGRCMHSHLKSTQKGMQTECLAVHRFQSHCITPFNLSHTSIWVGATVSICHDFQQIVQWNSPFTGLLIQTSQRQATNNTIGCVSWCTHRSKLHKTIRRESVQYHIKC